MKSSLFIYVHLVLENNLCIQVQVALQKLLKLCGGFLVEDLYRKFSQCKDSQDSVLEAARFLLDGFRHMSESAVDDTDHVSYVKRQSFLDRLP